MFEKHIKCLTNSSHKITASSLEKRKKLNQTLIKNPKKGGKTIERLGWNPKKKLLRSWLAKIRNRLVILNDKS